MAQSATMYRFHIDLSDIDHGLYESLDLRVARHPSEDEDRVVVRVLARAIAHEPGLAFGRGLSNVEDAALWRHSPAGEIETWIEVGMPSADRLHRASKAARTLRVFTDKPAVLLRKAWSSRVVHGATQIEIVQLPRGLVRELARNLGQNVTWYLMLQDGQIQVASEEHSVDGPLTRLSLQDFLSAPT
ncbi:MAG: YaeQ family protein [Nannocystaceae bacterium]